MNQELMRAVALLCQVVGVGELTKEEEEELEFLRVILQRASRAQRGTDREVLRATAGGLPQPKDT